MLAPMMMKEDLAALATYEASLAAFERAGDTFGRSIALSALGGLAARQRDYGAARALFEESVFIARQVSAQPETLRARWRLLDVELGIRLSLRGLADVLDAEGQPERAARLNAAAAAAGQQLTLQQAIELAIAA
jgi:hypothetical protein